MEQQPISNNFRILLLILTVPQSIAVGFAVLFAWLPAGVQSGYASNLGDQPLPALTRFLLDFSEKLEPSSQFLIQIGLGFGFLHLSVFIVLIWGITDFSKLISRWSIVMVSIWASISAWFGLLGVFLVIPFVSIVGEMFLHEPVFGGLTSTEIASLVLLLWIILLAISVWLFLRKKMRSTNQ